MSARSMICRLAVCLALLPAAAAAQLDKIPWAKGPTKGVLGSEATINVPADCLFTGMNGVTAFLEALFSVASRNAVTPFMPVKRQPAGTLIVASEPSIPFVGPLAQGILSSCAAAAAGRSARQTARRQTGERASMQPPANESAWRGRRGAFSAVQHCK